MANILAYTSPARGHLYPVIPTLLELRARGHAVHVRTLADEVERLRTIGLDAGPMASGVEQRRLDDWKAGTPLGAMDRVYTSWLDRADQEVADLRGAIEATAADVVFVDINSWGAQAAAEASGLPLAVFSPYFLNLQLAGRPPLGLGLAPRSGLLGRVRDESVWAALRVVERPYLRRLNALRATLELPHLAAMDRLTARADRVIAYTAEPFEYTHGGWPANVHFVGPGIWEPASDLPPVDSTRPLVLVTCSTEFQDDGKLVQTALAALADEDLDVVATTAALDPSAFVAPANAQVLRFAAHGPLLRRAVAVVCHGGMGITQKALAAGVPVCVVPWGRDQKDVAQHVVRVGAGRPVARSRLSVDRLRAAIRETIAARPAAQRIAEAMAAPGGPARAADVVDALVADRAHCGAGPPSHRRNRPARILGPPRSH